MFEDKTSCVNCVNRIKCADYKRINRELYSEYNHKLRASICDWFVIDWKRIVNEAVAKNF